MGSKPTKAERDAAWRIMGVTDPAVIALGESLHPRLQRLLPEGAPLARYFEVFWLLRAEFVVILGCCPDEAVDVLLGMIEPAELREQRALIQRAMLAKMEPAGRG